MERTSMTSGKGLFSSPDNPMPQAKKTSPMCGPSSNKDAKKANSLLQQAQMKVDSLRGKSGT